MAVSISTVRTYSGAVTEHSLKAIYATVSPVIHRPETVMSKGMDQKKSLKKKALKTPDEKRQAKKAKKAEKAFLHRG